MNEVTLVLERIHKGEPSAAEALLPLVYDELRKLAAQKMAQEKPSSCSWHARCKMNGKNAQNGMGNSLALEELRKCIVVSPFVAFTLNIADGRRIPVTGRDFILIPPEKGRIVYVYQRNGESDILDALLITGVTFDAAANVSPPS